MNIVLIALFAATGAASLIYVSVWRQALQIVIGSTPMATAVALGSFTAGMFLGIVATPRVRSSRQKPLQLVAIVQLGTAAGALLVPVGLHYVDNLSGIWLRSSIAAVLLLPAAVLTGALISVVERWRETKSVGILYASAFAGGAAGCVLSGFYLLRVFDVTVATVIASAMNLFAAAMCLAASRRRRFAESPPINPPEVGSVWMSMAFSGCAALGVHSIWTRLLSVELGTSIFSFPLVLSVLLLGLTIGACAGAALAVRSPHDGRNFAICQILATGCTAWSAYMLIHVLPYWPIDPALTRTAGVGFQLDLFRSMWVVLPAACMWGASLPLARAAADTGARAGSAALLGASIGAASFGLLFIPVLGTKASQQILIGLSIVAAVLALAAYSGRRVIIMFAVLAAPLILTVSDTPGGVIAYGPSLASKLSNTDTVTQDYFVPRMLAMNEGLHASLAVSETSLGIRSFHMDGKIQTSTARQDIRLHRMLGHIPGLLHARPRSVLIAGLGAALTAGSLSNHPTVERIVICDIEPRMSRMIAELFARKNSNVMGDSRLEIVHDDARHYLLTTDDKFDIITSEPTQQWAQTPAGAFTREYFGLVKRHLNPDGIFAQAVPLRQNSDRGVRSALATFFESFPDATIWSNDVGGKGYDFVVVGENSAIVIDADRIQEKLNRPNHVNVLRSLKDAGFPSATELLATYEATASDLAPWIGDAEINRDRNLRLQYLAGLSINRRSEISIYDSVLQYGRTRGEGFTGSPEVLAELNRAIDRRKPRTLSESQTAVISNGLIARPPRRISMSVVLGDQEGFQYATELREAITRGGWEVGKIRQSEFSDTVVGLQIFVGSNPPPPEANELFQTLRGAGFTVEGNFDPKANANSILLVVGTHP